MTKPQITIEASPEDKKDPLSIELVVQAPADWAGRHISLLIGGRALPPVPADGIRVRATLDITAFRTAEDYALRVLDESGADLSDRADCVLRGAFFDALHVSSDDFLDKVQLHHSRLRSRHLLELAAHGFYLRNPAADFVLRAAALTILSHRFLEKPADSLSPGETARVAWLLAEAEPVTREGAALVRAAEEAGRKIDWRHVRWTVSLATVAAHLSLYDESYEGALSFFQLATGHTHLVGYAKVSALNLVICAFAEGLLAHMLGRSDHARTALTRGVEAVKPIVQAQNLLENVWVLGDLQNVLRAARQCYIALLRLSLLEVRVSPPVIDEGMQIEVGEVRSPLQNILLSGRVPRLAAHLARHGGR